MIINGKQIAAEILEMLAQERELLPPKLTLGVLMGEQDAAAQSFVKIKEKVADKLHVVVVREEVSSTEQALRALERLSKNCSGVIVQLPLPSNVDTNDILQALDPKKDIDAIGPNPLVLAPVVGAIEEILRRTYVEPRGKQVLVVGQGRLVGAPAAAWFTKQLARVNVVSDSINLARHAQTADIIVLGAGAGSILKPEMLKEGVVILDAGTSEQGGKLAGDADPACADIASVFTPVPGGIGPIAVAMIFKNLFKLAKV